MEDRRPSVLVIDDDRSLLLGLQAILSRAGYDVLTAGNGETRACTWRRRNAPTSSTLRTVARCRWSFRRYRQRKRSPDCQHLRFLFPHLWAGAGLRSPRTTQEGYFALATLSRSKSRAT
jgi:CheY-like chemotaxis protein